MERATGMGRAAVVRDARGGGRALRATWHHDAGVVVLSVWRDNLCVATSRLSADGAAALVDVLTAGLADAYPQQADDAAAG